MAKNFNGMAIVSISAFTGENATRDKNGKMPVVLTPLCGVIPSKRILSGTIAENMGLIPGKPVMVSFSEGEEDATYGRQFTWASAGVVTPMEILQAKQLLGEGRVESVLTQAEIDAVELARMEAEEAAKAKAAAAKEKVGN